MTGKTFIKLAAFAMAVFFAGRGMQAQEQDMKKKLQKTIETFLSENPSAPGVCVTVICPEKGIDWSGTAGKADRGEAEPLTPRHTFRIASNTKTYVAASVLRLAEMGRVNLDDPLSKHLTPEQSRLLKSDGYDVDSITLAQVLSHTAGFGDHTNDDRFEERIISNHDYPWTPDEQLRLLVEWREPVGKPGEKYQYSDSGYVLLGTLLEKWTGMKLGPAVRELLRYDRLGLKATYWEYMEKVPEGAGPRAHQYFGEQDVTGWTASYDLYGGGGIIADTRDMALFMRKLLAGEVFDKPRTLQEMLGRGTYPYRLGLMVKECDGRLAIGHQGFWNTFAFQIPSLDMTVSGCILNHGATNGFELVRRLTAVVASAPMPPSVQKNHEEPKPKK